MYVKLLLIGAQCPGKTHADAEGRFIYRKSPLSALKAYIYEIHKLLVCIKIKTTHNSFYFNLQPFKILRSHKLQLKGLASRFKYNKIRYFNETNILVYYKITFH